MQERQNKSLKNQTLIGFAWMLSGSGIQSIMQFILLIVLARLLDPESFGIASAALVIVTITNVFSTLGFGPALIQKKDINNSHIGTAFTISLLLSILFGAIIYFISSNMATFFGMNELGNILKVMSIVIIITGISQVSESLIQRELMFNLLVRIQVISYFFYGVMGIILAILDFGVWALIIAYITQLVVKMIISLYLQPYKINFKLDKQSLIDLLYFSSGHSIAKISSEISSQGDNFIIAKLLGADALGLYNRAYQLMVTPANLIGKVLEMVLFPVISKVQSDIDKVSYIYGEGIRLTTTAMLPISIFLFIQSENIILLLFGEKWLGLNQPFKILALSLLFRSSYKISDSLAKSLGAVYMRALVKWVYAGAVLLFTFIGQFYGLSGVAIGVSFAIVLNYILMTSLAIRLTKIRWRTLIESHLGGLIISIVLLLTLIPFNILIERLSEGFLLELSLSMILFGLIYIILILISPKLFVGIDGKEMIEKIKNKLLKRQN